MNPRVPLQLDLEGVGVLSCPLDTVGPGCSDDVEEPGDIVVWELKEPDPIGHVQGDCSEGEFSGR